MAIKTCTGTTGRAYVHVEIRQSQSVVVTATGADVPMVQSVTGDVNGAYTFTAWAAGDLTPTGTYNIVTEYLGTTDNTFNIQVPQTAGPFPVTSILVGTPTASPSPNHVSTLIVDGTSGVAINAAGDVAARSFTASANSPYTSVLPGATSIPTPAGISTGKVWDWGGAVYNARAGNVKLDGVTDDTVALQAVEAATSAAGGGVVELTPGVAILDFASGVVVGTVPTGSRTNTCLALYPNTWLRGAGQGLTTLLLKPVTRTANVSGNGQSMLINQHPESSADVNIRVTDLTLDCNRQNQGPYAYNMSLAVPANFLYRGLSFWAGSDFGIDNLQVKNCPDFAVFVEANATLLDFGKIRTTNCVAGVSIDQGTNGTITKIVGVNTDAAYTINTTSTTVVAPGSVVVTPASMAGIAINSVLDVAVGTSVWETVLVTAATGSTFTAYFANAHGPGSYTINDARFHSDACVQMNLLSAQMTVDAIDIDYTGVLSVSNIGAGLEISGAKNVAVGSLIARGTFRALWLHSWNIGATHYIPTDISIGLLVAVNCTNSASGVFSQAVYIDDHALSTPGTDTLKDVTISSMVVRYGFAGAAIPNATSGIQIQPNCTSIAIDACVVDGGYWGLILNGCSGNTIKARLTNLQNQAVQIQASASRNRLDLSIDTTGIANAAAGAGVQFVDATACDDNIITVLANAVPGASWAIDLSASLGKNNQFSGNVRPCAATVKHNTGTPQKNYFNLVGYTPTTLVQTPAFAGSYTPDLTAGAIIKPGVLTATMTINAVVNFPPTAGDTMTLVFTQDGTGGRTLVWNAVYKTAWQPASAANAISAISLIYDGTNWQVLAGQLAVDQTGKAYVIPNGSLDTSAAGALNVGPINATSIIIGATGKTLTLNTATGALSQAAGNFTTAGSLLFGAGGTVDTGAAGALNVGANNATSVIVAKAGASVGFYGHAAVAQPAAPVTLGDVIAIIRGNGLSA